MKHFPLLLSYPIAADHPRSVPWAFVSPHEKKAMANHGGQTLQRLAERGGLSPRELYAVIHDLPWRQLDGVSDEQIHDWLIQAVKTEPVEAA